MFSIFKKQDKPEITDMVYLSALGKYKGIYARLAELQTVVLVYYFKNTWLDFKKVLDAAQISYNELPQDSFEPGKVHVIEADQLRNSPVAMPGAEYIFLEHFPAYQREAELLQQLYAVQQVQKVAFYIAVTDPVFVLFGGDQLVSLMKTMGLSEEESISHSMVTKSIERAQQKIQENLRTESAADDAEEWLRLNISS